MASPFTHKRLSDVKDSAPEFGFGEHGELHFAREELGAQQTGFTYHRLNPGDRRPAGFGHRHEAAEEVYVVLSGSGLMKLDDEIIEIDRLDAVRVAPEVWRCFSPGPEGLEMLAFGSHHEGDGELDPEWWVD